MTTLTNKERKIILGELEGALIISFHNLRYANEEQAVVYTDQINALQKMKKILTNQAN